VETITGHAKAIAAVLAAVLAAVVPAIAVDGPLNFAAWVNVVILAAGAVQVYNTTNTTAWGYGKLISAVVTAAAVVVLSAWSDGSIDRVEWVQIATAALGAFVTYRLPNTATAVSTGRHQKVE
jgi:hypothetical protein